MYHGHRASAMELHCGLEVCVPPPYLDIQPVYNQHHVCIVCGGAMITRKGSSPGPDQVMILS